MISSKRIGDYAVDLGFCSPKDVSRALEIQCDLVGRGHPRMLLGILMVRYGIIDGGQLIQILKTLEANKVESILAD